MSIIILQSQCSIPSGLLKLPDVSNKIPTKNLIAGQFPRRISLVTAVVNPATRESSSSRYVLLARDISLPRNEFPINHFKLLIFVRFCLPVHREYREDIRGNCHDHL